jgi:hypothetical protein
MDFYRTYCWGTRNWSKFISCLALK